jgi:hypothetical protein
MAMPLRRWVETVKGRSGEALVFLATRAIYSLFSGAYISPLRLCCPNVML